MIPFIDGFIRGDWLGTACQGSSFRQFHRKGKGKEGNYTCNTVIIHEKVSIIRCVTSIIIIMIYNTHINIEKYNMVRFFV